MVNKRIACSVVAEKSIKEMSQEANPEHPLQEIFFWERKNKGLLSAREKHLMDDKRYLSETDIVFSTNLDSIIESLACEWIEEAVEGDGESIHIDAIVEKIYNIKLKFCITMDRNWYPSFDGRILVRDDCGRLVGFYKKGKYTYAEEPLHTLEEKIEKTRIADMGGEKIIPLKEVVARYCPMYMPTVGGLKKTVNKMVKKKLVYCMKNEKFILSLIHI